MNKYLLFEVNGDPSKDLAATAVVSNLAKVHPDRKIIVTTFFPELWLHHPKVWRVYKLGNTPYFHEDYIEKKDTLVLRLDPFLTEDFIYRHKHLIQIWSEMYKAPYESKKPEIYFTAREYEATGKMTKRDKPLFLFETQALINRPPFDIWKFAPQIASLPYASVMAIVSAAAKAGLHPIHLKRADENPLAKIEWMNLPLRQTLCAISLSERNLFLNSFAMQAAAAEEAAAAVISQDDDWRTWGYPDEKNLIHFNSASPAEIIQKLF